MRSALEKELDLLLGEDPQAMVQREASAFDLAAAPHEKTLILFGAGGLGRKTLKGLRQAGIRPLAFADNNSALWNREVDGLAVLPPAKAAERYGSRAAFVVTIWRAGGGHRFDRTQAQLRELGCEQVVPVGLLFWKYQELFLDYYCLGLPSRIATEREVIREAFSWLEDDVSRREFVDQVRWRLWLDFSRLTSPDDQEQYFPQDVFHLRRDEVFVDCGAFDGDSLAAFLRHTQQNFRQIVALEPDPLNYNKMSARVAQYPPEIRQHIRLEQIGAADFNGTLRFDAEGSLSSAANSQGSLCITCNTLDSLLAQTTPTYIKMDIEGAEPEALQGAASTIRNTAPVLAISAYHRPNHLWRIPELLKSLRDDYRLFLRPHNEECWDTVCYAVPPSRVEPQ